MRSLRRANTMALPALGRRILLLTLVCGVTVVAAIQSAADVSPAVPNNIAPHPAPTQPLPFSHKAHLATGLACETCHIGPDPGIQMTFPATAICMSCHRTVATDKPAIVDLHVFSRSGQQIPWVRVYAITPGVSWSHRAHLDAGAQCETCHGDIKQSEAVAESKAIRAMATCISCHQARGAAADCVTCHAWPSDKDLGFE